MNPFDVLNDIPYRNSSAVATYLGGYVTMPGKWTAPAINRLAKAGKIEHIAGDGKKALTFRVGNRQVQDMKNRREHFEMLLRSLPHHTSGNDRFHKPASWGDEWFTLGEIGKMLGSCYGTVKNLTDRGLLKSEVVECDEPFLVAGRIIVEIARVHRRWLAEYLTA